MTGIRAVIMAGGEGTRIRQSVPDLPKALIDICGKPVLQRQLECLAQQGITDITVVTGYMGEKIRAFFGDGSDFGVHLSFFDEPSPLGTAGALFEMSDKPDDDFFVINGDLVFDFDASRMLSFHTEKNALATVFTHPNSHPADSALIEADSTGKITAWLPKSRTAGFYKNRLNAGIHILSPELLHGRCRGAKSLDKHVLLPAVKGGRVYAYDSAEYVRDMGTPERLDSVRHDVARSLPQARSFKNKRRAVFLDRDGTLNVYKGYISRPSDIELMPGVAAALAAINSSGYLAVIITNQAVVARGECTEAELAVINNALETLLGEQGAYVDAVYYCPHHPDAGYAGEVPSLKIDCECRKPKPAMLFTAARELNISLTDSFMVGDSYVDTLCGSAAGCKTIYLTCGKQESEIPECTAIFESLTDFVKGTDFSYV